MREAKASAEQIQENNMPCNNPLLQWRLTHRDPETGKPVYEITSRKGVPKKGTYYTDIPPKEIPCGKCLGCKIDKAKEWAVRCVLEAKQWECNEMLTLTYDQEHVPKAINEETGEVVETLKPEDVDTFLDSLRTHWRRNYQWEGIRKFEAGEYGTKRERPHYHILLFNFKVFDKKLGWINKKGNPQYVSDEITKLWGKGLCTLEPVNYETCEYVARYLLKKQKADDEVYEGRVREYTKQSTRPGIGKLFFENRKEDIYETQKIWIPTQKKVKQVRPPKYFDNLLKQQDEETYNRCKQARRELMKLKQEILAQQTQLSEDERMINRETTLERRVKKKPRQFESGND